MRARRGRSARYNLFISNQQTSFLALNLTYFPKIKKSNYLSAIISFFSSVIICILPRGDPGRLGGYAYGYIVKIVIP
jgi:hypothetical protein